MTFEEIMDFVPGELGNILKFNMLVEYCRSHSNLILPFVGAGMVVDAGYPSWPQLLEILGGAIMDKKEKERILNNIKNSDNYEQIATDIEKIRGDQIYDNIRLIFGSKSKDIQYSGMAINILPYIFNQVVTTNYDCTIENVYMKHGKYLKVAKPFDVHLIYNSSIGGMQNCIYKLHGDIDSDKKDIIFTKESYDRHYNACHSYLREELNSLINNKSLLFLGASLRQDRLAQYLVRQGHEGNTHFAIIPCSEDNRDSELARLRRNNITHAILYPDGQHECVAIIIKRLLKEVHPNIYREKFEHNGLAPAAVYSISTARTVIDNNFIPPLFRMKKNVYREEVKEELYGLEELYRSIRSEKANCFFLIDGMLCRTQESETRTTFGGGGMGKSTVLAKIYMDNIGKR